MSIQARLTRLEKINTSPKRTILVFALDESDHSLEAGTVHDWPGASGLSMYVGPEHARDPLRGLTDAQCLLIHDGDVVLCPIQIDGPDGVLTAIEEEIVWPDLGATRPHLAER